MTPRSAKYPTAAVFTPADPDTPLPQLRVAAQGCRGCDLYRNATQAVFGERLSGDARGIATIHPSAVLRLPEREDRDREFKALVNDLEAAAALAKS